MQSNFLDQLKKFGPAQNILRHVKGQGIRLLSCLFIFCIKNSHFAFSFSGHFDQKTKNEMNSTYIDIQCSFSVCKRKWLSYSHPELLLLHPQSNVSKKKAATKVSESKTVGRSGNPWGAGSIVVGIICPPGWDRVNWVSQNLPKLLPPHYVFKWILRRHLKPTPSATI